MSLYTMGEICEGCRYAVLHSCGYCLKECKIKARDKASCIDGSCTEYIKEEEKGGSKMIPKADIRELEETVNDKAEEYAEKYEMDFDVIKQTMLNVLIDLLVSDLNFQVGTVSQMLEGEIQEYIYRTDKEKYKEVMKNDNQGQEE